MINSEGKELIKYLDKNYSHGRFIIDGSFTRFWDNNWNEQYIEIYVKNAAVWLSGKF